MSTNPVDQPYLYDSFWLAGQQSPGVAKLNFPTRDEGWDAQQGKGEDGGETVHNGAKLIDFDAEIYLWVGDNGADHFEVWEAWKPVLLTPVKKNAPKALDIYHPQLEGLGISSVVVKSWTEPQPDGNGGATVKIKFLQYSPPKKRPGTGKPKGSAASKGGAGGGGAGKPGSEPDPNADLKAKVSSLTDEYNSI